MLDRKGRGRRKSKSRRVSLKPSRKARTKTRKPKYLSLLHLEESLSDNSKSKEQQLNLFPLHPENLVEDRDTQYDNVCLFFNTTEEDNVHAVTLNGLLDSESSDNYKNEPTTTTGTTATPEESLLSPSLTCGYSGEDHTRLSLVRSAMKGKKGRDESEEKWVVYSEVVEKKEMEEVNSCGGGGDGGYDGGVWCSSSKKKTKTLLALKLDYEEIMNAWSDKGPLYLAGESPQTVPDLQDDAAHVLVDAWGSVSNLWRVLDMASNNVNGFFKLREEFDGKENWRRRHREASVLRYKEKRQNRLFSKRVRYEVRKLNAEKRPRLKGRFVKRD